MSRVLARLGIIVLACAHAAACTSMKVVDVVDAQTVAAHVRPGDSVAITTKDGRISDVVVKAVDERSISSGAARFDFAEIDKLELRVADPTRMWIFVAAIAYAIVLLGATALLPAAVGF